jgi:hypothetical protein
MLAPRGALLIFVPNCGGTSARRQGVYWGPMCCEKHPLAFDAEFFRRSLPDHGFRLAIFSDPYDSDKIALTGRISKATQPCTDGDELMVWAQLDPSLQRSRSISWESHESGIRRAYEGNSDH